MTIYQWFNHDTLYISNDGSATIGIGADIQLMMTLKEEQVYLNVMDMNDAIYLNGRSLEVGEYHVMPGSILEFLDYKWRLFKDEIHCLAGKIEHTILPLVNYSHYDMPEHYPIFHRSPRLIYRSPDEPIVIDYPPQEIKHNKENIVKMILPPTIMITMSIVMLFIRPNAFYMLATIATTILSLIFSIHEYIKNKKQYRRDVTERHERYTKYLDERTKQLHKAVNQQRFAMHYHYPSVREVYDLVMKIDARIYEKNMQQFDFLSYRLGLGTVPLSFDIRENKTASTNTQDPLERRASKLAQRYCVLDDMPITIDLLHGPLGYVGARSLVLEQLQWMMCQIATFHSYHDVRFVVVTTETEYKEWEWLRFLLHLQFLDMPWRGIVYDDYSRTQLLNQLTQYLKDRRQLWNEEGEEKARFQPEIVLIITDEQLILDHAIMELLAQDLTEIGVRLVYVKDVMTQLPENVTTTIYIRDQHVGELVMAQGHLRHQRFALDHLSEVDKERIPRQLAGLNHQQTVTSSIPDGITFLEMYDVQTVNELNILSRWQQHSPYKTLAVPLGVNSPDHIVELNLHEKAHGPHGLIAGTTGSGKSEVIQSYILSLAVNFHPYDVAFLLIDYKGGGMANLFKNLPHLLGTITNLDGAQSMRALISINAELKRRQRLFSKYNVNHINQYQKLYKESKTDEPMPHLFLISDEFAELKAEQPEFMAELISTARIGRSLGIHLILATQKPAGVVDDQIWSNSKFKIALKVADKADSMEMLKTPDAADITQPGRGYLQVGNNEIYELFQSAYSGAEYNANKEESQDEGAIYRVTRFGDRQLLSQDLSGFNQNQSLQKLPTELEAVIDEIASVTKQENIEPLPQPWLPPLKRRIFVSDLRTLSYREAWAQEKSSLTGTIGFVDIPSEQAQRPLSISLSDEGNLVVYASPGYGKSSFLQTLTMELVRQNSPEQLHMYLLDFGTNGLLPLKDLPHVADTMQVDEDEKIMKFIRRLQAEVKYRKQLLSDYSVANVRMYEEATGEVLPRIVIVIDSYEGFKDLAYEDALNKMLISVTRDGKSIGIHVVVSATGSNAMRTILSNNFKAKIALRQNSQSDIREIVGRTTIEMEDIPGRGFIKLDEPRVFQTALACAGETDLEVIQAIKDEAKEMDKDWQGARPLPIPMMPEDLTQSDFLTQPSVQKAMQKGKIPLGLDYENVAAISYSPRHHGHLAIVGDQKKLRHQYIKTLMNTIMETKQYALILLDSDEVFDKPAHINGYVNQPQQIQESLSTVFDVIQNGDNTSSINTVVCITDVEPVMKAMSLTDQNIETMLDLALKKGIAFIIGGTDKYLGKTTIGVAKLYREYIHCAVLLSRVYDQSFTGRSINSREPNLKPQSLNFWFEEEVITLKYGILEES